MKLSELLTDASKWTQHTQARNASGTSEDAMSDDAVCFCLAGAARRVSGPFADYMELRKRILSMLPSEYERIVDWNDAPERTFEDVRKLLEENDL